MSRLVNGVPFLHETGTLEDAGLELQVSHFLPKRTVNKAKKVGRMNR